MTLEQIRKEKHIAEEAVQQVLRTLQERTGLAPVHVDVNLIDTTTLMENSPTHAIGLVSITLERI